MNTIPKPVTSKKSKALKGQTHVPGDKSISHRALMFGALAIGKTRISGLLEGEDVLATAKAMADLGAKISRQDHHEWWVEGRGVGCLRQPTDILDLGNAGTATRLLMGLVSSQKILTFMTGDASLRKRPMGRVMDPLRMMGAEFLCRDGKLPLAVIGAERPIPIEYDLPVPSAQVKSAILLAGLNCPGITSVIESEPTRDHTENMLRHFGADIVVENNEEKKTIRLAGQPDLRAADIVVPGDISSAAFPLVAGLIVPGSVMRLNGIGLNPYRTGLLQCLLEMGAQISIENQRVEGGEVIGDLVCCYSPLTGIDVPPSRAPSMIDEYPILAVAAAFAQGTTRMDGIGELRVKESDRLSVMARGLRAAGVDLEEGPDWLAIHGKGRAPKGGIPVEVELDHRIAMSFLVLGMAANEPIGIDDAAPIDTSFPDFIPLMNRLGAAIG